MWPTCAQEGQPSEFNQEIDPAKYMDEEEEDILWFLFIIPRIGSGEPNNTTYNFHEIVDDPELVVFYQSLFPSRELTMYPLLSLTLQVKQVLTSFNCRDLMVIVLTAFNFSFSGNCWNNHLTIGAKHCIFCSVLKLLDPNIKFIILLIKISNTISIVIFQDFKIVCQKDKI